MGKHFNAELYRQFDRAMDKGLDEAMGDDEPPLTEAEKAAEWDHDYWAKLDASPVRHVQRDDLGRAV
jgi:hypothetical protein